MENQIYRVQLAEGGKLEFFVCTTNETQPHREIKELGIVIVDNTIQYDSGLDPNELDSLIEYLENCRSYIKEFNKNSKPLEEYP